MDSDSSANNDSDNEQPTDDVTEEEKTRIIDELSTMSFEELQKLKEEMGSKLYNKTVLGEKEKPKQRIFKRVNKNRPREMSSKIIPRITKKPKIVQANTKGPRKQLQRDPRFDQKCGEFDKDSFRSNYKFVEDIRRDEKKKLKDELKEAEDPHKKKQIKLLIQRIDNQLRESEKLDERDQKRREEKETIYHKKQQGEKPVYKKKSERKIEELVEQYEELKKSNKIQKHIERRSKKLMNQERKNLSKVN